MLCWVRFGLIRLDRVVLACIGLCWIEFYWAVRYLLNLIRVNCIELYPVRLDCIVLECAELYLRLLHCIRFIILYLLRLG